MVMSSSLPDLLDPWRAVDGRFVFAGRLPLSSLPRLRDLLLDMAGDVVFRLAFFRDEEQRALLRCEVNAGLKLCCQRCLEALEHQVGTNVLLALVSGVEEERRLAACWDPLLVMEKLVCPRDLIEDELLLALPQIPMHDPDVCGAVIREGAGRQTRSDSSNPFSVLAERGRKR